MPGPEKEFNLVLFAFWYEALNTYGILNLFAIDFIFLAISNVVSSCSITQGPAIKINFFEFLILSKSNIFEVLVIYLFKIDSLLGKYLWIPARIVIALAIIVVGTKLGQITNQKGKFFDLNEEIIYSILLKLCILPFIIFIATRLLNFDFYQSSAVILQAGTPTAISTILMAEAYRVKQKIASKILFTTTLISIITIPLLKILMNRFN